MEKINNKYYEPLEQMMSVRHQYMAKIISLEESCNIYQYFKNKQILDLGCGTGKFLYNYYELGSICTGVDIIDNFQIKSKKNFKLIKSAFQNFISKNKKKYNVIFLFEFVEHLSLNEREILFNMIPKLLKKNGIVFLSTLNKNIISEFMSINIAENLLSLIPRNTHDPNLFIKPSEIQILSKKNDLKLLNTQGISYNPILKTFKLSNIELINYFAAITN
tara:strand:+ start:2360 stop:3016 length:657 start_codon:yes stop_codon:yes gene_type:complete